MTVAEAMRVEEKLRYYPSTMWEKMNKVVDKIEAGGYDEFILVNLAAFSYVQ